jgi:hypothetical protein
VVYELFLFFLGKGGNECSLKNGNSGDPVAFGEIIRQRDIVKRVSANRQNTYISQVASSRVVAPTKTGENQVGVEEDHDDHDDSFFKNEGSFENDENPPP